MTDLMDKFAEALGIETPNPGSDQAIAEGCLCPVIDNGRGNGCGRLDKDGKPMFWINEECKVHAK